MKSIVFPLTLISVMIFALPACQCRRETAFQDQTLGARYPLGSSFISNGNKFDIVQFYWSDGQSSPQGYIEVKDQTAGLPGAGGSGYDIAINNASVAFDLSGLKVSRISFDAGYWGGNMNLSINGAFLNFNEIADIHNITLGDVQISASGSKENPGKWTFEGLIQSFEVGGQELFLDNICLR